MLSLCVNSTEPVSVPGHLRRPKEINLSLLVCSEPWPDEVSGPYAQLSKH